MESELKDLARLKSLQKRLKRARKFPDNTCPASRHLHMLADSLAKGKQPYMLTEEPEHCAEDIYSVIAALWELRTKQQQADDARALAALGGAK